MSQMHMSCIRANIMTRMNSTLYDEGNMNLVQEELQTNLLELTCHATASDQAIAAHHGLVGWCQQATGPHILTLNRFLYREADFPGTSV